MLKSIKMFFIASSAIFLNGCILFLLADMVKVPSFNVWKKSEVTGEEFKQDFLDCNNSAENEQKFSNNYRNNIRDLCMIKKGYKFYPKGFDGKSGDTCIMGSVMIPIGQVACESTKGLSIEQLEKIAEQSKAEQKIKPQD